MERTQTESTLRDQNAMISTNKTKRINQAPNLTANNLIEHSTTPDQMMMIKQDRVLADGTKK